MEAETSVRAVKIELPTESGLSWIRANSQASDDRPPLRIGEYFVQSTMHRTVRDDAAPVLFEYWTSAAHELYMLESAPDETFLPHWLRF